MLASEIPRELRLLQLPIAAETFLKIRSLLFKVSCRYCSNVLSSNDQKVVEQGSLCVSRIVESFRYHPSKLEDLVSTDLLRAILRLLLPGTTNLIGPNIHTQFLRVLTFTAKARARKEIILVTIDGHCQLIIAPGSNRRRCYHCQCRNNVPSGPHPLRGKSGLEENQGRPENNPYSAAHKKETTASGSSTRRTHIRCLAAATRRLPRVLPGVSFVWHLVEASRANRRSDINCSSSLREAARYRGFADIVSLPWDDSLG